MAELIDRLSAQVISTVSDYSRLDTTPESAALGVITATKGPVNELKLIQTVSALVQTFGEPSADHISLCSAYKIVSAGNAMYLVRVAHEDSLSSAQVTLSGTRKAPDVPSNATWDGEGTTELTCTLSGENFPSGIEGNYVLEGPTEVSPGNFEFLCEKDGVSIKTSAPTDPGVLVLEGTGITVTLSNPLEEGQRWIFTVSTSSSSTAANIVLKTKEEGTYANNYSVALKTVTSGYEIVLKLEGLQVASYIVSLNPESDDYILDLKAEEFDVELELPGVIPEELTPTTDDLQFQGGNDGKDGITAEDYIGVSNPSTGEATGSQLFLQPRVVAQMYPALGVTDKKYLAAMKAISVAKPFITCVFDTPEGLTLNGACDWINNEGEDYEKDPVLEGWMCEIYWPWETDSYNGYPLTLPPSTYVTINSLDCFRRLGPQLPVAGNPRGIINGVGVTTQIPSVVDRDKLVTNRINPIWDTGVDGVQIFGNETLNNDYTDLRSAHIARMLAQIVTAINKFTGTLEFELNDSITWQKWIDGATKILQVYKDRRGLNWFGLKMGLDTTTAKEIAQRQIRGQIGLQFVQDAEVFWLNYAVFASSATDIDF